MNSAESFLSSYYSNLLGEVKEKPRKKKQKNLKEIEKHFNKEITSDKNSGENCEQNESSFSDFDTKPAGDPRVTDDGFKIKNEIPPDDSDLSDAFESEYEDIESSTEVTEKFNNENKYTKDGFKIINEIPQDDSDVEDAFESDLDEEEWIKDAHTRTEANNNNKNNNNNNNNNNNLEPVLQKIKKPLLDLIHDFGMEDKIYLNENLKPTLKRSEYINRKKLRKGKGKSRETLSEKELQVCDYSIKRGKKKKQIQKLSAEEEVKKKSKEDHETEFKRTKYEIYKLGISSGTEVEKKEAKIDLLVKLGARPRKEKPLNYKKLIELRKEKKEKEKLKVEETRRMGMPVKKKPEVKAKAKDEINLNPGLGKFHGGVLKLSKHDIQTIKSS